MANYKYGTPYINNKGQKISCYYVNGKKIGRKVTFKDGSTKLYPTKYGKVRELRKARLSHKKDNLRKRGKKAYWEGYNDGMRHYGPQ